MSKELFNLGDELSLRLRDFCKANYDATKARVVRDALEQFISKRLNDEPEMRKRFEEARHDRLGKKKSNLHALPGGRDYKRP
ncbi:MAG: hypothetical protein QF449_15255 [Alphaproteobacteria bacterium]|jgi:hypothetical protein|nr:hypothetical protein [Alphaproteobacteria bacterium]MDP6819381.1 hypothetical protein [Alphaproteobacteria bacterium]